MCDHTKNIYLPYLATVEEIIDETPDVRTLRLVFQDEKLRDSFSFRAGQFAEYSAFGAGESTFCIASSPTRRDISSAVSVPWGGSPRRCAVLKWGTALGCVALTAIPSPLSSSLVKTWFSWLAASPCRRSEP